MEKFKVRKAVAAGKFYPSSPKDLTSQIERMVLKDTGKCDVLACVLPHAGYIYSGKVAAQTLSGINIKNNIILLGPNHTGYGTDFSIMSSGSWQTPLGEVKIASELAKKLISSCKYLEDDFFAHEFEHSLEVELPILQYFKNDFSIVPIIAASEELDILKEIGQGIAQAIEALNLKNSTLIIASSDMTHYESQESAEEKDKEAIEAILQLDEEKLINKIKSRNISMCGYIPVIIMLAASKALGAKSAKLIHYQTSADVTQDKSSVVGYAGITVY